VTNLSMSIKLATRPRAGKKVMNVEAFFVLVCCLWFSDFRLMKVVCLSLTCLVVRGLGARGRPLSPLPQAAFFTAMLLTAALGGTTELVFTSAPPASVSLPPSRAAVVGTCSVHGSVCLYPRVHVPLPFLYLFCVQGVNPP